jgi:hypothetical protein
MMMSCHWSAIDAEGDSRVAAANSADHAFSASRSAASSASFVSRILALRSDAAKAAEDGPVRQRFVL